MPDRHGPLTTRELRIIRGMIDEHEQDLYRRRFLSAALRDVRVLLAVVAGVLLLTLQVVELIYTFSGRR